MSLILNGTEIGQVIYNNVDLDKVIFDGEIVFEKAINEPFLDGYLLYMPVDASGVRMYGSATGTYDSTAGITYYEIDENANVTQKTGLVDGDSLSGLWVLNSSYAGFPSSYSIFNVNATNFTGTDFDIPNTKRGLPVIAFEYALTDEIKAQVVSLTLGENLTTVGFSLNDFINLTTINFNSISLTSMPLAEVGEASPSYRRITINVGEKATSIPDGILYHFYEDDSPAVTGVAFQYYDENGDKRNCSIDFICQPNGAITDASGVYLGDEYYYEWIRGTLLLPNIERSYTKGERALVSGTITTSDTSVYTEPGGVKYALHWKCTESLDPDTIGIFNLAASSNSDLIIPSSVKYVSNYCLKSGYGNLNSFTIPNSVQEISANSFTNIAVNYLTIGSGITHFPNNSFGGIKDYNAEDDKIRIRFMHPAGASVTFGTSVFYYKEARQADIYTDNDDIKAYDFAGDNMTVTFHPLSEWEW